MEKITEVMDKAINDLEKLRINGVINCPHCDSCDVTDIEDMTWCSNCDSTF